jgi:hypothetical protein
MVVTSGTSATCPVACGAFDFGDVEETEQVSAGLIESGWSEFVALNPLTDRRS